VLVSDTVVWAQALFDEDFGTRKVTLSRFTHPELFANRGFKKADKTWLYGEELNTEDKIQSRVADMINIYIKVTKGGSTELNLIRSIGSTHP
jgi:hypothetical protein